MKSNFFTCSILNYGDRTTYTTRARHGPTYAVNLIQPDVWTAGILLSPVLGLSCRSFRQCEYLRLCLCQSYALWLCHVSYIHRKSCVCVHLTGNDAYLPWSHSDSLCVSDVFDCAFRILLYGKDSITMPKP